ncbi:RNB domain-containing ribonuclease [Sulfurospirillum arcachonense]|uniref:RNB domain-containing ribonuclease n=1 Tax=Sulfurospirillum arcachonense TaxID=57666 RepID=UPI0004695905|nr:ribonuclease R family protein [Sulfurospirillum arcachonense]
MKKFLLALSQGVAYEEVPSDFTSLVNDLVRLKAIKLKNGTYIMDSRYRAGTIDISFSGTGFVKTFANKQMKDLLVESTDINGAMKDDIVIIKRLHTKQGRPKAKVILIAQRKHDTSIVYTKIQHKRVVGINIKNKFAQDIAASQKSLKQLPEGSVLKINNETGSIEEVLGVLSDPRVDEKISMELFEKTEFFSEEAELEAKAHGDYVDKSFYPNRIDLTHLPFCTIDPVDAKDFDDAIYFDEKECALYVAIADVSEYLFDMGNIDKEAKMRGFSIYFPHKSIPMLPRSLSENICSLKPNEDRLAFTFKITLDKTTYEPIKEELMNAIIHSQRRYTYDEIDKFLDNDFSKAKAIDKDIWKYLSPLNEFLKKVREKRLKDSFEFRSTEIRMKIDEHQNLLETYTENQTLSHSLIEDCMLLANKAAAKRLDYGIFRTHGDPSFEKIEKLLNDLVLVGISVKFNPNIPMLIKQIQEKADAIGIREEVDKLIIRSQQKAVYEPENKGHFGLGFDSYTHFTSPIRRYSDLTLHRLLKSDLEHNKKRKEYLLKNIDSLCEQISNLERESDKVAWDYMDRKYARWASERIGEDVKAIVTDVTKSPVAKLQDEVIGARIFLLDEDAELFDKVIVKIVEADIATSRIYAKIVRVDV